jgi:hypothetical protein
VEDSEIWKDVFGRIQSYTTKVFFLIYLAEVSV